MSTAERHEETRHHPPDDGESRLAELSDPDLYTERGKIRNTIAGLQNQLTNVNAEVARRERAAGREPGAWTR